MKGWKRPGRFIWLVLLELFWTGPLSGAVTPTPTTTPSESSFTVLCYHRFIDKPTPGLVGSEYRLPVGEFEWQLQYLKDHGITPVSLEQVKAHFFEGKPLPDKAVLLTFDDGFQSIYEKAYPLIKKFGYPGVLFLYTDFIHWGDSASYAKVKRKKKDEIALKCAQITEMGKNGLAIEAHTKSHLNLGKEEEKREFKDFQKLVTLELGASVTFIQEKFGIRSTSLAYPYGVYNEEVLKQTKDTGYVLAFTVNPGPNDKTLPPLKLKRNLILYPMKHEGFAKIFETRVLHFGNFGPGDGETVWSRKPLISVEVKEEVDPKTIELQLGNQKLACQYDPKLHLIRHRIKAPLTVGGHMLTLSATDLTGQKRTNTWYFRVKYRKAKPTPATKEDE